jgi:Ca2+-transporting ATPase
LVVLRALESAQSGLTSAEAARRLAEHGPNVLARGRQDGPLTILWRQIDNPLVYVLLAAAGLAIALGKIVDGAVVLAVVVLNSVIGFLQEHRASKAIEALRAMVPQLARVMRDGATRQVPAAELVPGDVVLLASGDKVPADMRLMACKNLKVQEAALTGESVPVEKSIDAVAASAAIGDRTSMCFNGTLVSFGTGTGVVTATGARTELGRISTLLDEAVELETPLTKALAAIGKVITLGVVAVSAVILAIGVARALAAGLGLFDALRETLLFAIALAVGAIPEGLPAIVTISLAIGVQRMARRRAIIRKLPAVETLGSTTVICSDKTGTLTKNEMTAQALWTPAGASCRIDGVGYEPVGALVDEGGELTGGRRQAFLELLRAAALCSDATLTRSGAEWTLSGDPTEGALVVAAEKAGLDVEALRRERARLDAIPFESEHQFMATLHQEDGARRIILKGAPEAVLARVEAADRQAVLAEVERMASGGMRVLAVADKPLPSDHAALSPSDVEGGMRLLGLVAMIDPPRPEAIEAVAACRSAGIGVKMITGDHRVTAQAVARQLGLGGAALDGASLAGMSEAELRRAALEHDVFARVAPEHKLRLVEALQAEAHVVAMTGDGVNDAPALKQANIGVAMGITGTAVSKESADVVLTDDNFASIVAAVEEGRRVFDNLVKSLAFVLPTNLGLALVLTYAVLFFPFDAASRLLLVPIEPTQILWINLVATVALALPLAFEAKEPNVMARGPRAPGAPILSPMVIRRTLLAAVLMTAGAVGLFQWEYGHYMDAGAAPSLALAEAQTMAVTSVIAFQIFYVLNCRSLYDSILRVGLFTNKWIYAGIALIVALQLAFIYAAPLQRIFGTAPLSARDVLLSLLVGAAIMPVMMIEKMLSRRLSAQ